MNRLIAHLASGGALPSWCTAHPETLSAILAAYCDDDAPILVEATCNQVNQFGGYTGMTPIDFVRFIHDLADDAGVKRDRLILGGDHLGPNPWKSEPVVHAMDKARAMVAAYAAAGFDKIHLDASMACADDESLPQEVMAARAADLCAVAEAASKGRPLAYVIGTEVPVPGGETEQIDALTVSQPEAVRQTLEMHKVAFSAAGLSEAFSRIVGIVTQPGVDFGNDQIFAYSSADARSLVQALPTLGGLVFEAHSTDYQSAGALAAMVQDGFRLLKVGPELTFAFRQAALALDRMIAETGFPVLVPALIAAMQAEPEHWNGYVPVGPGYEQRLLFGLSDRVRYYWSKPNVRSSWAKLIETLIAHPPAPGVVAQGLGAGVAPVDAARLPELAVHRMVGQVVQRYRDATGS